MPKKKLLTKEQLCFEESPKSHQHKPQSPVLSALHPLHLSPIPAELADKSWVSDTGGVHEVITKVFSLKEYTIIDRIRNIYYDQFKQNIYFN